MPDPLADHLLPLARKYLWWMPAEEAVTMPDRVIAQVMDLGDYDDMLLMTSLVGEAALCRVLTQAEVGQFSPKSWTSPWPPRSRPCSPHAHQDCGMTQDSTVDHQRSCHSHVFRTGTQEVRIPGCPLLRRRCRRRRRHD